MALWDGPLPRTHQQPGPWGTCRAASCRRRSGALGALGVQSPQHPFFFAHAKHKTNHTLWGEAGFPGGTMRRAAVRKRGSGSMSLYEHRLPDLTRSNRGQIWRDLEEYIQINPPTIRKLRDLIGRTDRRQITPDSRQADVCTRLAGREA